jgi:hypothetical protein
VNLNATDAISPHIASTRSPPHALVSQWHLTQVSDEPPSTAHAIPHHHRHLALVSSAHFIPYLNFIFHVILLSRDVVIKQHPSFPP